MQPHPETLAFIVACSKEVEEQALAAASKNSDAITPQMQLIASETAIAFGNLLTAQCCGGAIKFMLVDLTNGNVLGLHKSRELACMEMANLTIDRAKAGSFELVTYNIFPVVVPDV